jgi:hypothetical protein
MISMQSYKFDSSINFLILLLNFYILIICGILLIIILKNSGIIKLKEKVIHVSDFRVGVKNHDFTLV